jgi:ATP-dependent DNA helicase PIF1
MNQTEALDILKTGASVFLTGAPGSGKTYTVNAYVAYLRARGIEPAITASTGIAATHIGGRTVHSWCGIGVRLPLGRAGLERIRENRFVAKRIKGAAVLIIDEISMLSPQVLEAVDQVCRHVREDVAPFGGLQVVLVGDFFQMPPIVSRNGFAAPGELGFGDGPDEADNVFSFQGAAWRDLDPTVCYLSEQHRQSDSEFLNLLEAIRADACGEHERSLLSSRVRAAKPPNASVTRLFTHNRDVDRLNQQALDRMPGETRCFQMAASGPAPLVDALKRGCLSSQQLELKTGAQVMFIKNDPAGRFVNGTLGTVSGFDRESGNPVVETLSGPRITAEPLDWALEEDGKTAAKITQVPLRLAWAITVHKSQGMSLDAAEIDLTHAFEYGHGYVALSRVRALDGLYLAGWNERALRVHPEALASDARFRDMSDQARNTYGKAGQAELARLHAEFLRQIGARPHASAASRPDDGAGTFDRLRKSHANAYRPWSEDEEDRLRIFFDKGAPVSQIAETLGRKPGAIRSRMRKLGLIS